MKNLFKAAQKFQVKLGFYRQKIERISLSPELRRGSLVMDWEIFEKEKQISLFEVIDYFREDDG